MSKDTYHHGDLKRALLDAADELLEAEGLQGFTLRACARRAGVSHAAPAHHFGDARGLLSAVAEQGFKRLVESLEESIQTVHGDLDKEMVATTQAYVSFAQRFPEHFRIMFREDIVYFDMSSPPMSVGRTFAELTNVILRQRGDPELGIEDFHSELSQALLNDIILGWCFIHGYAHLKLEGQLNMIPEATHQTQMEQAAQRLGELIRRG